MSLGRIPSCFNLSFGIQAMSTTQGSIAATKGIPKFEHEPEHLLVLVHGIMSSPSDWTYAKTELTRQLGNKFLIYASSSNTYTKTFGGIDGAGRRLAEELPFLLGVPILEKLAPPLAPIFVGRTGRQLFLTDGRPSKPPLLLRMAADYEDKKFISALATFQCRIVYANVSYDHMVGWRTSSIRRESELVQPPRQSLDGYKHIVNVQYCPPVLSERPHFPPEAARAKEAAQTTPTTKTTAKYHDIMEEEMIRGLQSLGWKKVDVSFHSAFWPFLAHNNIHVKSEWLYNAGAGVIAHVANCLKEQESRVSLAANL
ncbi:putative alpha/beta hydrolase protein [Dioscorea alata]|uniref:Alpha/beta hydrolase protein n=1 Tax=Dioscorea alata TaxID=55571 RepID=A0ACB7W3A1_DIOAL|nr:putative alpha/beta hydrolase protein [Dioscorea alata]